MALLEQVELMEPLELVELMVLLEPLELMAEIPFL
jgi:hypothetical protein